MRLVFETGALAGNGVELPPGVTLVGRADGCDLVVPDSGVSGDHAELTLWPNDRVTVRDLESRNGTYADGERIEGTWTVAAGTELRFGPVVARLEDWQRSRAAARRARRRRAAGAVALMLAGAAAALALSGALGGSDAPEVAATPTPTPSPTATPTPASFDRQDAIRRAQRATVSVGVDGSPNGSGWVVDTRTDDALIVTNDHVVMGGTDFTVGIDGEPPRPATLVAASGCDDLALLRVADPDGLRAMRLGSDPRIDEELWVMGFPDRATDEGGFQLKRATVSALRVTLKGADRPTDGAYRDLIQVDGSLIPGNSGGPLVSRRNGRVVGVSALAESPTVGYAISAARVRAVLSFLRDGTSFPGMALEPLADASSPAIVRVTSPTLRRAGVPNDGSHRLEAVNGDRLDVDASTRTLCGELPELGDGVDTPVRYRIRRPDGSALRVTLTY